MQKFWGLDPSTDPVIEKIEFDKDLAKFYGMKNEASTTKGGSKKQTHDDALKIFFAVAEKEPSILILLNAK